MPIQCFSRSGKGNQQPTKFSASPGKRSVHIVANISTTAHIFTNITRTVKTYWDTTIAVTGILCCFVLAIVLDMISIFTA